MTRRGIPSRRFGSGGGFSGIFHPKSRVSPFISTLLLFLGAVFVIVFFFRASGPRIKTHTMIQSDHVCMLEVLKSIPLLKKTYGDSMRKILHIGPETCSVVSALLKEEKTEAWGLEPYDLEDADINCKRLVHKGIVRVADIKFPLPYRDRAFSMVIVSDSLDYITVGYLNRTLPGLVRVASDALVIFTGFPSRSRAKVSEPSKFGRPPKMRSTSWWERFFTQMSLEENDVAKKKFEEVSRESDYTPGCHIFHLRSFN